MSTIYGFISIVSFMCLLVGIVLLINLITSAFNNQGVLWAGICSLFPVGTYYYCRENWETERKTAIPMAICLSIGIIQTVLLWLLD